MKSRVVFENESVNHIRIAYPCSALQPYIEYYFEINTANTSQPFHLKGIPAANVLLAFQLGTTAWNSFTESVNDLQAINTSQLLGHISTSFNSIYQPGTHFFFIKLKPGVAAAFFKCGAEELENRQVDLNYLLKTDELEDRLRHAKGFYERVQVGETNLLYRLPQLFVHDHKFRVVQHCIRKYESLQLKDEKGLDYLCSRLHVTYASLRRYFITTVGYTPKFTQRTIRFKKALGAYSTSGYNFYHEDFGYTDFSHFVKDAKMLTGHAPAQLIAG
ncbi:MAG: hypothetical protein QM731_09850 [Chitinophagaceae bacterium]